MIDHISIGTPDLARAIDFYTDCFAPLGYGLVHRDPGQAAFGADGHWSFCLYPAERGAAVVGERAHVAVSASSRSAIADFHERALAAGAHSVRSPGLRPDVSERYYGAIVHDPDGHMIEVVHWSAA
ncbi:MAG TPA: VOC family protein [Telluria sp.]|nr:VOC family protein [Telluria sp.]